MSARLIPPFPQGEGVSGCETLWWSWKCRYFLFCLPNRKCHRFPACNWLICTVQNRKQWHFWLHHGVPHLEKPPPWENSVNRSITCRKMRALPVWRAKQAVMTFMAPYPETPPPSENGWNQLQAGKCRHFLFDKQTGNEVILNFTILLSILKTPSWKNGTDQSIYDRKMLTLPVF